MTKTLKVLLIIFALLSLIVFGLVYLTYQKTKGSRQSTGSDQRNLQISDGEDNHTIFNDNTVEANFIWALALHKPSYHKEFYLYQNGQNKKIMSKNGDTTKVIISQSRIFLIVNQKDLYQYDPVNKDENKLASVSGEITDVMRSPDGNKIAVINLISHDPDKIEVIVIDKGTNTKTTVASLEGGVFEAFYLGAWSSDLMKVYLSSSSGDAGFSGDSIYEIDIVNSSTKEIKSFGYGSGEGGDTFIGFDQSEASFYISHEEDKNGIPVSETLVKYDINNASTKNIITVNNIPSNNQDLYNSADFLHDKDSSSQFYTSLFYGSYSASAINVDRKDLGFFEIEGGMSTQINPNPGLNFNNACHPVLKSGNQDYLIYTDSSNELLSTSKTYIYNRKSRQNHLMMTSEIKGYCSDDFQFIGWV